MTVLRQNNRQFEKSKLIRIPPPFHIYRRLDDAGQKELSDQHFIWLIWQRKNDKNVRWD